MQAYRIDAEDLDGIRTEWDRAVDSTEGADPFCASSIWSFAAARSFPEAEPPVVATDGRSFAGFRASTTEDGARVLVGLDPIWGFATPLLGHPIMAAQLLEARMGLDDHDLVLVAGQTEDGVQTQCLAKVLGERYRLLKGPTEQRLRSDLSEGWEAWFARRSPRFRQRLRHLQKVASDAGVEIVDLSAVAPHVAMDRVLAIEARSWKGREETGLASPSLADFYRRIVWTLAAADALRLMVAVRDGVDVGFVLGGVRAGTYRGLQLSHDADTADLGLGHLLQWHQIQALEGTGIDVYDLGMDMDYKRRWADRVDETMAVIVAR